MIPYGRGASAITDSKDFAGKVTLSEAQQLVNDWFASMPVVKRWILDKQKEARKGLRQQTLFGRVRHYVINDSNMFHIQNNYVNTPIQSIASDLTLFSLMEIYAWLVENELYIPFQPEKSKARLISTVHDSLMIEVQDDPQLVKMVAEKAQGIMRDLPQQLLPNCSVPFKADIEIGYSWGALSKGLDGLFEGGN